MRSSKGKIKFSILAFAGLVASVALGITLAHDSAFAEVNPIAAKWFFTHYYQCLQGGTLRTSINTNAIDQGTKASHIIFPVISNPVNLPMPSLGYFDGAPTAVSCTDILEGVPGQFSGIFAIADGNFGPETTFEDLSESATVLSKLGYKAEDLYNAEFRIMATEREQNLTTDPSGNSITSTPLGSVSVKATAQDDGTTFYKRQGDGLIFNDNDFRTIRLEFDDTAHTMQIRVYFKTNFSYKYYFNSVRQGIDWIAGLVGVDWDMPTVEVTYNCGDGINWKSDPILLMADVNATYANIKNTMDGINLQYSCKVKIDTEIPDFIDKHFPFTDDSEYLRNISFTAEEVVSSRAGTLFTNKADAATARESVASLGMSYGQLPLTDEEKYDLYYYYLDNTVPKLADNRIVCSKDDGSSSNPPTKINLKDPNGDWRVYYVNLAGIDLNQTFYTLSRVSVEEISLQGIIDWFNEHPATGFADDEKCVEPDGSEKISDLLTDEEQSEIEESCFNSANALGWIICPIIRLLQKTIDSLYENVVTPFLQVDLELFKRDSVTYQAWQTFQSFANIAFVIFLLVIIFSQLTGVGIDNYGIKRSLPNLIVAVILTNLSYIICQFAVDISNILGVGLKSLFDGLMDSIVATPGDPGSAIGGTILGAALAGVTGILVATTWELWILPFLLALVSIVIGILFTFVLLGVRKAGIVILIVLSPLAMVCYMLPNTKQYFSQWFKAFSKLLLLFPICGLLMGGGNFAGAIISGLDKSSFWYQILAALLTVVPFFFLPTLIKNSYNALGSLGTRFSNLGNTASSKATGAIGNSTAYKYARKANLDHYNRKAAGVDKDGNLTTIGRAKRSIYGTRFGKALGLNKMQTGRMVAAEKTKEEDIAADATMENAVFRSELAKNPNMDVEKYFQQKLDDRKNAGDTDGMFSVIDQMKRAGIKSSHIANITRNSFGHEHDLDSLGDKRRSNFLRDFSNRYGNDFLKKDISQLMWAGNGGTGYNSLSDKNNAAVSADKIGLIDSTGNDTFINGNVEYDDLKDEDVEALSADRKSEMIAAGRISQQQAQRVWASNKNMDDTERFIMGAYAEHGAVLTKNEAQGIVNRGETHKGINSGHVEHLLRRTSQDVNIRQDGRQEKPVVATLDQSKLDVPHDDKGKNNNGNNDNGNNGGNGGTNA